MAYKLSKEEAEKWRDKERSEEYENLQESLEEYGKKYCVIEKIQKMRGQSGIVFFALNDMDYLVAIKRMPLSKVKASNPTRELDYYREKIHIENLYFAEGGQRCPYIADLMDYWIIEKTNKKEGNIFVVSDWIKHPFEKIPSMYAKDKICLEDVVDIFIKLCTGLDHIHRNLVHRDIKPDNIRFNINKKDNDMEIIPKIIDFGLACGLDTSLTVMGTPGYRAPERIRQNFGVGVDIYPMGIMLWEALNGYANFTAESRMNHRYQSDERLQEEFDRIDQDTNLGADEKEEVKRKKHLEIFIDEMEETGSVYLTEIIKKAIQPEEANRYSSAMELKQDLKIALYANKFDELLGIFKHLNSYADRIQTARNCDMPELEVAERIKQDFYSMLKEEQGIKNLSSSNLMDFFQQKAEKQLKPVISATKMYITKLLRLEPLDLPTEKELTAAYSTQIDQLINPLKEQSKRNVLDMASRLKRLYQVCELNNVRL